MQPLCSGIPTPFPGYTFLHRTGSVKERSEHLPQCPDARIPTSIQSQPIIDIHRGHTAASDAKYGISGDMANVMIDGASELEMGKKNNLPFGLRGARLQERCLEWISRFRTSMHLEFDEMQCKAEVTNTRRIKLSS